LARVHGDLAQIVGEWDHKSFVRRPRTRFRDGERMEGQNARSHNIHNANAGATPDFAWIEDSSGRTSARTARKFGSQCAEDRRCGVSQFRPSNVHVRSRRPQARFPRLT
jgi:hypothetical protein